MQTLIVIALVGAAVVYIGWRLWGTFMRSEGACGCGPKKGCAKMMAAMEQASRTRRG